MNCIRTLLPTLKQKWRTGHDGGLTQHSATLAQLHYSSIYSDRIITTLLREMYLMSVLYKTIIFIISFKYKQQETIRNKMLSISNCFNFKFLLSIKKEKKKGSTLLIYDSTMYMTPFTQNKDHWSSQTGITPLLATLK